MNSFDKFLFQNKDIIGKIKPLTQSEREQAEFERKNGFLHKNLEEKSFLTWIDKEIYFAKKNKKCPCQAVCMQAKAKLNSKEYREKVVGPKKVYRPKIKQKEQLMDYEEAKRKFWNLYLKESVSPVKFDIDEDNKMAIQELLKYFIQDPTCRLDLNKGICIAGGVGTGKTNLMTQLSYFTQDNDLETQFEIKGMRAIVRKVSTEGLKALESFLMKDICFDDIAIRQTSIKSYGTEINPLDELIQGRYERFIKRNSRPTHFTTNLDFNPNDENDYRTLLSMYDERSLDRIRQMCNFVYLGGVSRRR